MIETLNIELRKEILEISLNLENMISELLILYLNIEREERKAITNKGSNLSFKNKIDLLYDLDVLAKDEHSNLLLMMEFRNQFLHNYQCNSFDKAVGFLGADKSRKLLVHNDLNSNSDSEFKYLNSYRALHIKCMDIILSKIEIKYNQGKEKRKLVIDLANYSKFIIDRDTELLAEILVHCIPNQNDSNSIIDLKTSIKNLIENRIDEINNLQIVKDYQNDIPDLLQKVIKHFK